MKVIRSAIRVKKNTHEKIVENIENDIPHEYLSKIIEKACEIDEGEETLILSEEFQS